MDKRCMSAPDQPCRSTRRLGTAVKSHLPPLQLRGATFAFALVRPLELSEMQVLRCQRDVVLRAGACYDRSARSRHLAGSDAFGQDSPALSSPNALSCEPSTDWNAIEIGRATSELQSLMRISYAVSCL